MRILLVSDEPRDASMGGPKVALKLQAGLQGLGHTCEALFRPELGARPRSPRLRMAAAPWLARRAAAERSRHAGRYDVIDAASAEGWMMAPGAARVVVARSHGLEHRYYRELLADAEAGLLHKPWGRRLWYPAVRLTQVRQALRRARRVIVLSQADREWVLARGWQAAERIEVIPHGVDGARWQQAPAPNAERGAGVLFCGWWTTSKGVAYLAQAYRLLLERGVRAPLTLLGVGVGDASWPQLEARVRAAFVPAAQPLLRLLPRMHDEAAVFAEYRRHDLLICPSTSEGFGLVVVEALSQRLPVVCCQGVGAAELLRHEREALLAPARDAGALAAALEELWRHPERRRALGEAGRERVRELSWEAIAARTAACYQRALGAAAAAAGR